MTKRTFLLIGDILEDWKAIELDQQNMTVHQAIEDHETETGCNVSELDVLLCEGTEVEIIKGYTLKLME